MGTRRNKTIKAKPETTKAAPRQGNGSGGGPAHEQIACRAYELFLARGAKPGRPADDWYQAERELQARQR